MSEKGMKWYVLRAVSGKEAKVKEYIEAAVKNNDMLKPNVGEILLPTEKYAMLRNGKRVIKEKLYLPGYVLIQANLQGEVAHTLRFMPNVLGFLGGLDNPTPVKQADINRILGSAEETIVENVEVNVPRRNNGRCQSGCEQSLVFVGFKVWQESIQRCSLILAILILSILCIRINAGAY